MFFRKQDSGLKKRGSAFQTLFFLALVFAIFFLASVQFGQVMEQSRESGLERSERAAMKYQMDAYNSFAFHSARSSLARGSYESAKRSFGKELWVEYGIGTPPTLEMASSDISGYTTEYANAYLNNLENFNFGFSTIENPGSYGNVKVIISEDDLNAIDFSERAAEKIFTNFSGKEETVISSNSSNEIEKTKNELHIGVNNIRYWYAYKVLRSWANTVLGSETCNAMQIVKGSGDGPCCVPSIDETTIDRIAQSSVEKLKGSFDSYVTCQYEIVCRGKSETTPLISENVDCSAPENCPEGCSCSCPVKTCRYNWRESADPCFSGSPPDSYCTKPAPSPVSGLIAYQPAVWEGEPNCGNVDGSCYGFGVRHEISFIMKISCVDKKYQQPIGEEKFENLNFTIFAHVYLRHESEPERPLCQQIECVHPQPSPSNPEPRPINPQPGSSPPVVIALPGPSGPPSSYPQPPPPAQPPSFGSTQ